MSPDFIKTQQRISLNLKSLLPLIVLLILLAVQHQGLAATKGKAPSNNHDYASLMSLARSKGEMPVIIKFKTPVKINGKLAKAATAQLQQEIYASQAALLKKLSKYKPKQIKQFDHLPFTAMRLSAEGLQAAMRDPDVLAIYEDTLSRPTLANSSPLIGATAAASSGFSGQGQTVAILDTGVDKTHSFLAGKVIHEACFSQTIASQGSTTVCPNGSNSQIGSGAGIPCSSSITGCNHGTHVAGIAAGKSASFSGVAKDASIMAIQVFSRFTGTSNCGNSSPCALSYTSDQISALEHVYSQRNNFNISSVNMSLGGGQFTSACDGDPRKAAIDLLRSVGIATIISSGNEGLTNSMGAPACISSAISVGSTTKSDQVSSFSNSANFLDLLAPGSSINSSIPGGSFAFFSGTSMAAPQVTGAFAVLKSRLPSASVGQIENALKSTGAGILDSRNGITKPRIQIDSALVVLTPPAIPTLFISPTDSFSLNGAQGGPFSPTSRTFTLSNITSSGQSLNYSLTGLPNWLQLVAGSPSSGSIAAGTSVTISVSVKPSIANNLPLGTLSGNIIFSNTTNGAGNLTVPVSLTVSGDNDFFITAIPISQFGLQAGSIQGNNSNASIETGEPNHAKKDGNKSLWWKWTAPANGDMTIETCGSNFDTVLGIYTGTIVSALSEVGSNDDGCGLQSSVTFTARAGITYYIAVDGFNGAAGDITLSWNFTLDSTPSPSISILPATDITFSGASTGPFSPVNTTYSVTNVGTGNQAVVINTPPWLSASTQGFTLTPGSTTSITFSVNSLANGMPPGVYSGVIDFGSSARAVVLNLTSGNVSNDDFNNALYIPGGNRSIIWNNSQATKQAGEPDHNGNSGGKSVWWKIRAASNGNMTISTEGSTFDTVLSIYTGNDIANITNVASDDDSGTGLTSQITIPTNAGWVYFIAVDGYNGNSGKLQLNIHSDRPARNDFNGDGKSDILWRHSSSGQNYIYLMNGIGTAASGSIFTVPDLSWKIAGTGDFNGDGKADILWRNMASGQNLIYFMNGLSIIGSEIIDTVPDQNWKIVGTGDFNGDGKADILWRHSINGVNWLYTMNGSSKLASQPIDALYDLNWKVAGIGDFNGDGKADILWRHSVNGVNWLYTMDGSSKLASQPVDVLYDLNWKVAGIGDFNADSKDDILWRHAINGVNWLYEMQGNIKINSQLINTVSDQNWSITGMGDLDGDQKADILWRHNLSGVNWIYLMDGHTPSTSGQLNQVPDLNWQVVPPQ